jgi:hypothetical protein
VTSSCGDSEFIDRLDAECVESLRQQLRQIPAGAGADVEHAAAGDERRLEESPDWTDD